MLSGGNKIQIQIQTLLQCRYIYFIKIENYSTVAQSENISENCLPLFCATVLKPRPCEK